MSSIDTSIGNHDHNVVTNPIAVIIESSENTISITPICAITARSSRERHYANRPLSLQDCHGFHGWILPAGTGRRRSILSRDQIFRYQIM